VPAGSLSPNLDTALRLTRRLVSNPGLLAELRTLVADLALLAQVDRVSLVLTGTEDWKDAKVAASSDDLAIEALPIQLDSYPELMAAFIDRTPRLIADAEVDPLLSPLWNAPEGLPFRGFALFPLVFGDAVLGALCLRHKQALLLSGELEAFLGVITNTAALALHHADLARSLSVATQATTSVRAEAERRVQLFQRYADFFESSADGIIVVSRSGRVLFSNPRAREIIGFSETELSGKSLLELFSTSEIQRTERLLRGFADGVYPRGVDLSMRARPQGLLVVNASFSALLHEENAVLLSFRDVTGERRTAVELKQTKEFLERVIESSIDAIVSADLQGTVLLFNRAAARIFRYAPSEVIGKLQVEKLYPPGVAREVMRLIRSSEVDGYGRLEEHRVDMLASDGEEVPVVLSASLVMDSGRPIGSVGIFTDIRERLQMEKSLFHAQEELRSREKQAIVAELAGAAAHELNQPLTSVIGYAELLRRKLASEPTLEVAAGVIIQEAERMAEIVRKVGRITHYQTKSYVGSAKILDLEKSSEPDE
jgi:PAS domain S-box-containing protein